MGAARVQALTLTILSGNGLTSAYANSHSHRPHFYGTNGTR